MITEHNKNSNLSSNLRGYQFLLAGAMLYLSIMLCNAILTNRYIGSDHYFVLGGSFTSPFFFIIGDIIAEIYGYKITKQLVWWGFICLTIFVFICQLVLISPYPSFFINQEAYALVLGKSLVRIDISAFIAYIISNLANVYIITRWKALLKGRYFWLRSLGASTISEALYSLIAILMMELNSIPLTNMIKVIFLSYLIKLTYAVILAWPSNLLVSYIKKSTGIDVYDFPKNYTPFKYLTSKHSF